MRESTNEADKSSGNLPSRASIWVRYVCDSRRDGSDTVTGTTGKGAPWGLVLALEGHRNLIYAQRALAAEPSVDTAYQVCTRSGPHRTWVGCHIAMAAGAPLTFSELVKAVTARSCVLNNTHSNCRRSLGPSTGAPDLWEFGKWMISAFAALIVHAHIINTLCKRNIFGAGCANGGSISNSSITNSLFQFFTQLKRNPFLCRPLPLL